MRTHNRALLPVLAAAICLLAAPSADAQQQQSAPATEFGLGRAPTQAEIDGWNIDAVPSGAGLPKGSGSAAQGETIYAERCVACHGEKGEGPMDRLAGGIGSLASDKPVKTVGSYWPYATTLYDYIHRAMPFDHPQSLSDDDVYAVAAYVLFLNDLVEKDAVMNAESLPQVKMPNRDGFYGPDPRPDVHNMACMRDCEPLHLGGPAKPIPPSRSQ
jgi:cytochrome c